MSWRRIVALGVPVAVLVFAVGVIVGLEVQRGPNWRLELDEYVARKSASGEPMRVETVSWARKPWNFNPSMGLTEQGEGTAPSFPPRAVRCALLRRESDRDGKDGSHYQIVFLVHHSDALYHVGWIAYEGPQEPFGPELARHLKQIGCDLKLD